MLPCVCSARRRTDTNSTVAFREAFEAKYDKSTRHFPYPVTDRTSDSLKPFFFAIDCWPDDSSSLDTSSNRLCRIPKALQLPYTAVTDAVAMEDMLQVLEPLSHMVHFVLIGKGSDVIRFQHRLESGSSGDDDGLNSSLATETALLDAMAMSLIKHGFPLVSILEGGMGGVLQFLMKCDGHAVGTENEETFLSGAEISGLGLHVLVDVDNDQIDRLFNRPSTVTRPSALAQSLTTPLVSVSTSATAAAVSELFSSSLSSTYNLFKRR